VDLVDQEALLVMIPFNFRRVKTTLLSLVAAAPLGLSIYVSAQTIEGAVNAQVGVDNAAAASQERINQTLDKTQDAASKYAQSLAEAESMEKYNKQLGDQVKEQEQEMVSIEKQLLDIETTNREVQPLMQKMVDTLQQFVALDVPFLLEERTARVKSLQALMAEADVAISEKYRRIIEAYQIELEYGRTLDSYEGVIGEGATARTVDFVRLGRIALMYQTLDGTETGYWNAQEKKWTVDNSYAHAVSEARRVAKKNGAPDLLTVPVPAPQEVRS
jgi:seryl-tRNA synthetase